MQNICKGISAPEGWKFQLCKDNLVYLVRVDRVGDWEINMAGENLFDDPDHKDWLARLYSFPMSPNRTVWYDELFDPSLPMSTRTPIKGHRIGRAISGMPQDSFEKSIKDFECLIKDKKNIMADTLGARALRNRWVKCRKDAGISGVFFGK